MQSISSFRASRKSVDLITYRLSPGVPALVPKGLLEEVDVVPVPHEEVTLSQKVSA